MHRPGLGALSWCAILDVGGTWPFPRLSLLGGHHHLPACPHFTQQEGKQRSRGNDKHCINGVPGGSHRAHWPTHSHVTSSGSKAAGKYSFTCIYYHGGKGSRGELAGSQAAMSTCHQWDFPFLHFLLSTDVSTAFKF